jgi:NitT/TauT family transport system substrate-binding protein
MDRRRHPAAVLLTGLALLAAACETPPAPPPLRVGLVVWPGYEPLHNAVEGGLLGPHRVRLFTFPSTTEVARALEAGQIDAAAITADELLHVAEQVPDAPPRAVLVLDVSHGGDAIVAHPPLRKLADLRGRRVGVEGTGLGAYVLSRALTLAGLDPADLTIVQAPRFDQERRFRDGSLDAVVVYEPERTQLLSEGAVLLFDSRQIPGEIVDLLVVRPSVLVEQEEVVRALVAAWFEAEAWGRHFPDSLRLKASRRLGLTGEALDQALTGFHLPGLAENQRLLSPGPDGLYSTLDRLGATMRRHGLHTSSQDPATLLDASFLPAAP